MTGLIHAEQLEAFYGASQILHGVDLKIARGEQAQHEGIEKTPRPEPGPPVQPGEGPEPLPDYAIWMRGRQAGR